MYTNITILVMTKHLCSQNTLTNYHSDWRKKIHEKNRLESQKRVYITFKRLFEQILSRRFQGNIIDVGSGDDSLVTILNQQPKIKAVGIDIDRGVNFETDRLPFKTGRFDIAVMNSVIEHLYDPGNLLTEIRRILKENGCLIIITPNFDLSHFAYCDLDFYDDPTHVHPYFHKSLNHLMRIHNYKQLFLGVWTVNKPSWLWKLPMKLQFYIGGLLPFYGNHRRAPSFLKGKSRAILAVFENKHP